MKNIIIREAAYGDYLGIREVHLKTWLDTYPNKEFNITREDIEQKFQKRLQNEKDKIKEREEKLFSKPDICHYWVAISEKEIVGFCSAEKNDTNRRVGAIYVLPEFQGRNVGKALFGKALEWLGNEKDIFIDLASYNKKALEMYLKHGFVLTGKKSAHEINGKKIPVIEVCKYKTGI